jgi:plasmid stabilization system protein ParE
VTVGYSTRAIGDLSGIADYLVSRSPQGAKSVETAIHRTIKLVAAFPRAGRVVEKRRHVRVMPVGRYPYLIFYIVKGDDILVLHVRHASRKPVMSSTL